MKLLTKYVFREFLVPFLYCLAGFSAIYILFELSGSFSRLMDAKLPLGETIRFFLGYLSPFIVYLAPAALMLATLYSMWNLCRHGEITAMRSSGVSFFVISRPILFVAAAVAISVAWLGETFVPSNAQWAKGLKSERFDLSKVAKMKKMVYRNSAERRVWTAEGIDAGGASALLSNVKVTVDRPDGSRLLSLTAPEASYLDGEGGVSKPPVRYYGVDGREVPSPSPSLDSLELRVFPEFTEKPADIFTQNREWMYSSVGDKFRFIALREGESTPAQRRENIYDAWAQALAPLACIVMALISIPAGIATSRQTVFKGVLGAIALFFAFWAVTLGGKAAVVTSSAFPPVLVAAFPYALFLFIGWRLFRRHR